MPTTDLVAQSALIERVAAQIRRRFVGESSGHDWYHIQRVWKLTQQIAAREGANLEIAELGALVHDIADWKFCAGDETVGPREARRLLSDEGVPGDVIEAVADIVATISFKGAGVTTAMKTLEGQCVQDADRLDRRDIEAAFDEQTGILAAAGADLIILETFRDVDEILLAARAARRHGIPVMASIAPGSLIGATLVDVMRRLDTSSDIDVLGINCHYGPAEMLDPARRAVAVVKKPLVIMPNAESD